MELLVAISQIGSVTAAAASTGMSQPAASAMLRRVETQLGFPLFSRKRQRLELTASGRALLPEVTHALAALEAVERRAESMGRKRPGRLTVGAISAAGATILPGAVKRFQQAHSKVPIALRTGTTLEVVEWAATQRIDVGLVLGNVDHEHAQTRCLAELQLVCVMNSRHPLARAEAISIGQLAATAYIGHSRQLPIGALTASALERAGHEYRPAVEVAQFSAACALAEMECGLAVLDTLTALYAQKRGLIVRRLDVDACLPLNLVWPLAVGLGPLAARLTEDLQHPLLWSEAV